MSEIIFIGTWNLKKEEDDIFGRKKYMENKKHPLFNVFFLKPTSCFLTDTPFRKYYFWKKLAG